MPGHRVVYAITALGLLCASVSAASAAVRVSRRHVRWRGGRSAAAYGVYRPACGYYPYPPCY